MNDLLKFFLISILLLFILFGVMLIIGRDKYSHYNMLSPEGKCKWKVAKEICEENGYEFKNINIPFETAKCLIRKVDGEYKTIKIKLCEEEIKRCIIGEPKSRCD